MKTLRKIAAARRQSPDKKQTKTKAKVMLPRKTQLLRKPKLPKIPEYLKNPADTIETLAVKWLCEVDYYEDRTVDPSIYNRVDPNHPNARSVGFDYDFILAEIRKERPDNRATRECLRWYASYIRSGDLGDGRRLVQRRPRCKAKTNK